MIGKNFKVNVIMRVMLLAGSVCAGDLMKVTPTKENTASSSVLWQQMVSDTMQQIVDKQNPAAAKILLYDIQQKKIIASKTYGRSMPPFAPMSLLKPFVITAALEAGAVTTDDFIDCENGRISVEGRMLLDVYKWQKITVSEILKNSSNIGTWKIAKKLGFSPLEKFLAQIGFKKHLATKEGDLEFARYAIGAKHLVSPEDLISAWVHLLKYPQTIVAIRNPLGTTSFHLQDNQHKYTYAVIGYLPVKNPQYILLLTAHDFTKSSGSTQGLSYMYQRWKDLEAKFNREVK